MPRGQHSNRSQSERFYRALSADRQAQLAPLRRHLLAAQRSDGYIRNTLYHVSKFADWLEPKALAAATRDDVTDWVIELNGQYAPATVVSHRMSVQVYFSHLRNVMGLRDDNPVERVPTPAVPDSQKDVVPLEDLARVLDGLDGAKRYRDAAIVSLFADTGLRVSEVCRAVLRERAQTLNMDGRYSSIDLDLQRVFLPGDVTKSKRERFVEYGPQTALRLDRWQAKRPDPQSPWLFTGQPDHGEYRPYTASGMLQRIKHIFDGFGIPGIGPHDLRHTWATHSLDHPDAKETAIMAQAGWSPNSKRLLRNYTHRNEMERAAEQNRRTSPLAQIG